MKIAIEVEYSAVEVKVLSRLPVIDGVSVKGVKGAVELPPKKKVKTTH